VLSPGARIDDRYEIIDALGSGGMGAVYRARRLRLGDEVAIKVIQATPNTAPEARERFLRESRACAQLRHPNIVGILDFGFDSGNQPYMVMELLSGPSLREEIDLEAPMPAARVLSVLGPVASALQLAHDRGITHRDLKPANIVAHRYESGERVYKVIDFGLAAMKATGDQARLTDPQFFLGTLAYAAPEQMRGEEVTPAADVYAVGVIAYEMLTGARPHDGGNQATLITSALTQSPMSPAARRNDLPRALDEAVMRALDRDISMRWKSVTEFIEALQAALPADQQAALTSGQHRIAGQDSGLLSKYELGPLLGRGRLGSLVYLGTHRALGNEVAIRVLKRDEQPNWDVVRARFLLEARTLQVSHPGLLQVRDFAEDERAIYVVTDLIQGPSLRQAMAETGPMPWPRVSNLILQALSAVAVLNRKGGFICGVNPDMIRLRAEAAPGATADRSASNRADAAPGAAADASAEFIVMSTAGIRSVQDVLATMREQELRGQEANEQELPYVAPEILMGGGPNARADVFTIGVLAYHMLTGTLPFKAPSLPELMGQMLTAKPAPPATLAAVPEHVNTAILRAIEGVAANRFESAESFANSLR
jgi:serine/threonine-protein kinase